MTDHPTHDPRDRLLWQTAKARFAAGADGTQVDDGLLAEYLDGGLSQAEVGELEALLAGSPSTLERLLAARASLGASLAPPTSVIEKASALFDRTPAKKASGGRGFFSLPNLSWMAATAALVVAVSIAGFEVGRDGYAEAQTLLSDRVQVGVLGVSERDFAM